MTATDLPSSDDVRLAVASVRAVLGAVDRGELEGTGLEAAHLAGAANALEQVITRQVFTVNGRMP